ncbi:LOW QUALITY PROTEIN: interferon-induced very large GTPase 1-like [Scyliorhinus canicula]|uniref:LOW QUALITY PROTEIN: interferon-induced very large GTPase 1-like n=1 Tax=Scyliorhinus canicula TaxID=7830 RepID=UPI0018F2DD68|nr:LOW QUALITY PROTEIN: interferon-induced very large GTPase 1-like [Scyliorhinus canicula]
MVLGATGAGKTTLINGMINYILGVEWEDNFRYKLIDEGTGRSQAESQTSSITAYELHHREGFQIDYSLTIIDTPGFGDTRGITRDKLITDQIQEFFTSPDGVDQIDVVCFVAQASLARLTDTQKYIFDSILSIFGKDIAENIQILVTFADGHVPPVLEAINVAEVPCPKDKKGFPVHFKFNNSAVFAQRSTSVNSANKRSPDDSDEEEEEEDGENIDASVWKLESNSLKEFFSALSQMERKSLPLTKEVVQEDRKALSTGGCFIPELLTELGLESKKLSLNDVLNINRETLQNKSPYSPQDIPGYFLQNIMMVNSEARNLKYKPTKTQNQQNIKIDETREGLYHSLDIIVSIFLCADPFLQQELMLKMSLCQFALPLLLPAVNKGCTFLLWALRSIVKMWCPLSLRDSAGFQETNMVTTRIPIFSFIRFGSCSISKSMILNEVLSPYQQHHNLFIHHDMECGNLPRRISDGLVELCWYLPSGSEELDLFPEPMTILNLRGDAKDFQIQVQFLTNVSSAVFIFIDNVDRGLINSLKSLIQSPAKTFIVLTGSRVNGETNYHLHNFIATSVMEENQILLRGTRNNAEFTETLRSTLRNILEITHQQETSQSLKSLEELAEIARDMGIEIDEDGKQCSQGKARSENICNSIKGDSISKYKLENMSFQGLTWQQISKIEKDQCRSKHPEEHSTQKYCNDLEEEKRKLRNEQRQKGISADMKTFITALTDSDVRKYFLQWMKFGLDSRSRDTLSVSREEYKSLYKKSQEQAAKQKDSTINKRLQELDQQITGSSLGLEHFMREMGLVYETLMNQDNHNEEEKWIMQTLPTIAADLMLDGFPLELIDGDVSNIPLQWVTDVLRQLKTGLAERPCVFVLTVLGVQSTGKSTLLNTMFGLQFAVSSGRCTRGAFMQLIQITGDLQTELGCGYIMVINTEGLKAPELSNIDGSYEHDNELATLVIGLSDVTLVNMSMENSTEMKDVLQIVVHAFTRMREVGKRPVCYFVHQNVSAVSAHDQNIAGRKQLLDVMTRAAAKMEKRDGQFTKFSDVLEYDAVKNNWNIPGLWHGIPPMAAVNTGYSHNVFKLKIRLFENLKEMGNKGRTSTISEFIQWTKSLWNAVKYENLTFSFRNSLVAEAYKELSVKYTNLEWKLRKEIHSFLEKAQNRILNTRQDPESIAQSLKSERVGFLNEKKEKCLQQLKEYYYTGNNSHFVEKYREHFVSSIDSLIIEQGMYVDRKCDEAVQRWRDLKKKCDEAVQRWRVRKKLNDIKGNYLSLIEKQVNELLQDCRQENRNMDEPQLEKVFEKMWQETISTFKYSTPPRAGIMKDMEKSLVQNMPADTKLLNQQLSKKALCEPSDIKLQINQDHVARTANNNDSFAWTIWNKLSHKSSVPTLNEKDIRRAQQLSDQWAKECQQFVMQTVNQEQDYDSNHCRELLRVIDEKIQKHQDQKFTFTECFRADFKLHICGFAVKQYEVMEERFRKRNDPLEQFEKEKAAYCQNFKDIYQEKHLNRGLDQTKQRAELFWENCLIPAIIQAVDGKLGLGIVEHMRHHCKGGKFLYRKNFKVALMLHLKERDSFDEYYRYINHTVSFEKEWLEEQVKQHCAAANDEHVPLLCSLALDILQGIIIRVREALKDLTPSNNQNSVSGIIQEFKEKLGDEIQIPQEKLGPVTFQSEKINPQNFKQEIESLISTNILTERVKDWGKDIAGKITNFPTNPSSELYTLLGGCGEQCPFCGVLCDCTNREHSQHSAEYHWSRGLNGWRCHNSAKLISDNCTTYVASDEPFRNKDTNWEPFPFKKYRELNDHYSRWDIAADTSITTSAFWKWVYYKYNRDFAAKYSCKPADDISSWDLTWDLIQKDIEEKYHLKISQLI